MPWIERNHLLSGHAADFSFAPGPLAGSYDACTSPFAAVKAHITSYAAVAMTCKGRVRLTVMGLGTAFLWLTFTVVVAIGAAPAGPWDAFNLAPATRIVRPTSIKEVSGPIQNAHALLTQTGRATLSGNQSWLTLDFGKEVRFFIHFDLFTR